MPSASTRLTVAFVYSLPLTVLKSSASEIDAGSAVKSVSVAFPALHTADSAFSRHPYGKDKI